MIQSTPVSFYDWTPAELKDWMKSIGQPTYRAHQILQWVYQRGVQDFQEMTNLSKSLREEISRFFHLDLPPIISRQMDSSDQTTKILLRLPDGEGVEAVCIPQSHSQRNNNAMEDESQNSEAEDQNSNTLCLSTQAGCMFACRFCASGQLGLNRNLTAGEILTQILAFQRLGKAVSRIVFMGTGEPLHNLTALRRTIDLLCAKEALGFSTRRLTLSTVGLAPEIYRIALEGWKVKLAVSLHATTDEKRAELIPLAAAYQLDQLMDALRFYQRHNSRRISFEYLMLDAVNDQVQDADRLKKLCDGLICHVNLIPFNPVSRTAFKPSPWERIEKFKSRLHHLGIDATIRHSRGQTIDAACGQLRLRNS